MRPRRYRGILVSCALFFALLPVSISAQVTGPITCATLSPTIIGTSGNDVIFGTDGDDVIAALGGNDIVYGLDGDDVICGDAGNDALYGGDGEDWLYGGFGRDYLAGELGPDGHVGGEDNDVINAAFPGDRLVGQNVDFVDGGPGNDTIDARDDVIDVGVGGSAADFCSLDSIDFITSCEVLFPPVIIAP